MYYQKIQTLWKRDEKTHKIIQGDLSLPEFAIPKQWVVSEKVDGTNVRVVFNSMRLEVGVVGDVRFFGKTGDQLHPELSRLLYGLFTREKLKTVFPLSDKEASNEVILFGEGYGRKVNGVKGYGVDVDFILFDVAVKNEDEVRTVKVPYWWLSRANVKDVAQKLGIKVVPELGCLMTTEQAIEIVSSGYPNSIVAMENAAYLKDVKAEMKMEGIVCRTEPMLLCRDGSPLMWKLKLRDFK